MQPHKISNNGKKGFFNVQRTLLFLILPFLAGCFDYNEKIVIMPDFSGYVDIEYQVPVNPETGRSLISFLPVSESEVVERYSGLFRGKEIQVEEYRKEDVAEEEAGDLFPTQVRVRFRVRFSEPEDLENILVGNTNVYRRANRLHIQRIFPTARSIPESAGSVIRRYRGLSFQAFSGKKMKFSLVYPWYYDMLTNHGSITRPGLNYYVLPLENTMKSGESIFWNVELRANPRPQ